MLTRNVPVQVRRGTADFRRASEGLGTRGSPRICRGEFSSPSVRDALKALLCDGAILPAVEKSWRAKLAATTAEPAGCPSRLRVIRRYQDCSLPATHWSPPSPALAGLALEVVVGGGDVGDAHGGAVVFDLFAGAQGYYAEEHDFGEARGVLEGAGGGGGAFGGGYPVHFVVFARDAGEFLGRLAGGVVAETVDDRQLAPARPGVIVCVFDRFVLEHACGLAASWPSGEAGAVALHVNVSPRDVQSTLVASKRPPSPVEGTSYWLSVSVAAERPALTEAKRLEKLRTWT